MMSRTPALFAMALCLGVTGAAAQELSTESACIAALRKSAERLGAIENHLSNATRACVADQTAAANAEIARLQRENNRLLDEARARQGEAIEQRQRGERLSAEAETAKGALAAERDRAEKAAQRSSTELAAERDRADKSEQRRASLQADNDRLARDIADLRARLSRSMDAVNTAVAARLRELFAGPVSSCETRPEFTVADGVANVRGRLLRADDMKRRIAEATNSIAGASVRTDELVRVEVCGRPLGEGWVVATGESGPRRLSYGEVTGDVITKLPEGTSENCTSIGAKLDGLRDQGAVRHRAFWVRRPGSDGALSYCSWSSDRNGWVVGDIGVNLRSDLLVQRSQ